MKLVSAVIFSAIFLTLGFSSYSNAQTEEYISGNVVSGSWSGTTPYQGSGGGSPGEGGPPGYNSSTDTIYFSWQSGTAVNIIGVNAALSAAGTGIQISGVSYNLEYYNQGDNRGTLSLQGRQRNISGSIIEQYNHNFAPTTNGWTPWTDQHNFSILRDITTLGNYEVAFTGKDANGWGGYYGPMIRNIDVRLRYSIDPCVADPQSNPSCPGFKTYYSISDDGYALVTLPFGFPFYGKLFTHSLFFDNGVVSFYSPNLYPQRFGGQQFFAEPLNDNLASQFHYSIMPLWSDLLNYNGSFYTQGDSSYLKYTWENVSQFGYPDRLNTFSLEIRPTGYIGVQYDKININGYPVTAGYVGNASLGEWNQIYHSSGSSVSTGGISNWSTDQTVATDCSNALAHPGCPGYEQAFYDQQCAADPLYDSGCPGFTLANYNLQCSISALYDSGCPGYETAYFNQQCSLSALYNNQCPGYETAYFNQQCSINALYNESCPGYETAYFNQQCSINALYNESCPGYETAYFNQQCSLSALYNESCPGYQQAFFNQQCELNTLYNNQCPGYAAAFILQNPPSNIVEIAPTIINQPTTSNSTDLDPTRNESTVVVDAGGAELSLTGEISTPTGQTEAAKEAVKDVEKEDAKKEEEKKSNPRAVALARSAAANATRLAESRAQESVELSQLDQSVSDAIGLGTGITLQGFRPIGIDSEEAANSSDRSSSQNNLNLQAGNDTKSKEVPGSQPPTGPSVRRGGAVEGMEGGASMAELARAPLDFNQYLNSQLKDSRFYESREIYRGQRTVDNARAQRFLNAASDKLHQEMVDQQYGK